MAKESLYRLAFISKGEIYEMYVKQLYQSDLYGFVEVEEFVFGNRAQVVVDPAEEKLKAEFAGVKRSFIPLQAILRIDEVEQVGTPKITTMNGGTVTQFPGGGNTGFTPRK